MPSQTRSLTHEQRRLLDRIIEERVSTAHAVPGRVLRLQGIPVDEIVPSLPPGLLRIGGSPHPHESYDVTLEGALQTRLGGEIAKAIEDTLRFFRHRLRGDPRAQNFSSAELIEFRGNQDDTPALLLTAVQLAGLSGSGSFSQGSFSFQFPHDIEQVLKCETIGEIADLRNRTLADASLANGQALVNAALQLLKQRGASSQCPRCGANQWQAQVAAFLTQSYPHPAPAPARAPALALTCMNCGHMALHNLAALGLA